MARSCFQELPPFLIEVDSIPRIDASQKKSVPNLSDRRSFPESGAAATFRKKMKESNFLFFSLKSLRIDSFSLIARLFEKLEVEG